MALQKLHFSSTNCEWMLYNTVTYFHNRTFFLEARFLQQMAACATTEYVLFCSLIPDLTCVSIVIHEELLVLLIPIPICTEPYHSVSLVLFGDAIFIFFIVHVPHVEGDVVHPIRSLLRIYRQNPMVNTYLRGRREQTTEPKMPQYLFLTHGGIGFTEQKCVFFLKFLKF